MHYVCRKENVVKSPPGNCIICLCCHMFMVSRDRSSTVFNKEHVSLKLKLFQGARSGPDHTLSFKSYNFKLKLEKIYYISYSPFGLISTPGITQVNSIVSLLLVQGVVFRCQNLCHCTSADQGASTWQPTSKIQYYQYEIWKIYKIYSKFYLQ